MANPYGITDSAYNAIVASIKKRADVVKKNADHDLEAGRGVSLINDRVVYYDPESSNKLYGITTQAAKKNQPVSIQSSGRFVKDNMGFKAGVTFYVGTHGRIITDPTGLTNKQPLGTGIDENSVMINFGEDAVSVETDPIFTSHIAHGITAGNITNWTAAYNFSQGFDLSGAADGDTIRYDLASGKWLAAPSAPDTNFGNTDITFTGDRIHNLDVNVLEIDAIGGSYWQLYSGYQETFLLNSNVLDFTDFYMDAQTIGNPLIGMYAGRSGNRSELLMGLASGSTFIKQEATDLQLNGLTKISVTTPTIKMLTNGSINWKGSDSSYYNGLYYSVSDILTIQFKNKIDFSALGVKFTVTSSGIELKAPTNIGVTAAAAYSSGGYDLIVRNATTGNMEKVASSVLTPDWSTITSKPNSGNFIYNQIAVSQSANMWISGWVATDTGLSTSGQVQVAKAFGINHGLSLDDTSGGGGFIRLGGVSSSGFTPSIQMKPNTVWNQSYFLVYAAADSGSAALRFDSRMASGPLTTKHIFEIGSYTDTYITVAAGGNLLIGTTTNSTYKLDVNGKGRFGTTGQLIQVASSEAGLNYIFFSGNGNSYIIQNNVAGASYYNNAMTLTTDLPKISFAYSGAGPYVMGYFLIADGTLNLNYIPNETVDPDKILVSSSGKVKYMTRAQLGLGPVFATDVEITDSAKGLILKDSSGGRWRITIDTSGTLVKTSI